MTNKIEETKQQIRQANEAGKFELARAYERKLESLQRIQQNLHEYRRRIELRKKSH